MRFDHVDDRKSCNSKIGRHNRRKDINLTTTCGRVIATIQHEMGHAMGLYHEHQRPNRDQWIVRYELNYEVGLLSSPPFNHSVLTGGRTDVVGGYDTDSVMHYWSNRGLSYSLPGPIAVIMPSYANRQELSINTFSTTDRGRIDTIERWHNFGRLHETGVKLDDAVAADVDNDGYDDLVLESEGAYWWSHSALTGWRPLEIGGSTVEGRDIAHLRLGEFDGAPGIDALIVSSGRWTLYGSGASGNVVQIQAPNGLRECHIADIDRDGLDDVFVISSDLSWGYARGGDLAGALVPIATPSRRVQQVALTYLAGRRAGLRVVAVVDNKLVQVAIGSTSWQQFLASTTLPRHPGINSTPILSLRHMWFVHITGDRNNPDEPIDLLMVSDGVDGSGVAKRGLVFIENPISSAARRTAFVRYSSEYGIDATRDRVIGYFQNSERVSVITPGAIVRGTPPNAISRMDALAIGMRHASWTGTYVADRFPQFARDPSAVTTTFSLPYFGLQILPQERFEVEATLIATTPVRSAAIAIARRARNGAYVPQSLRLVHGTSEDMIVREVFSARPGEYRVTIAPVDPPPASSSEAAIWEFNVAGSTCNDGFLDVGEQCDRNWDGTAVVACRPNCRLPACGDGILDQGEFCDNGAANSNTTPNACRTTCQAPRCGDGAVDSGEQCDAGAMNGFTPNQCRPGCTLPVCGDGVHDSVTEQCDYGAGNSFLPDKCRPTCTFPTCGDSILDTRFGDRCDDGNAVNNDGCPNSCAPLTCGNGTLDVGETCDGTVGCFSNCHYCGDAFIDLVYGEQCDDGAAGSMLCSPMCAGIIIIE